MAFHFMAIIGLSKPSFDLSSADFFSESTCSKNYFKNTFCRA